MNKFEKLIEYIINDEDAKARELFHNIVVEKSRDIYEGIMQQEEVEGDETGQFGHEVSSLQHKMRDEEAVQEDGDDEDGAEDEQEFKLDGDDEAGDLEGPMDGAPEDEFGGAEGNPEEQEIEQKVMNIDTKMDELLAKFDSIMGEKEAGMEEPMGEPGMEEPMAMGEPEGGFPGEEHGVADEARMFEAEEDDCDHCGGKGCSHCEDDHVDEGKMPMKTVDGKKVPAFSADGKGANDLTKDKKDKEDKAKTESRQVPRTATELMREYAEKIKDMNLTGDSEGTAVGTGAKTGRTNVNTKYTGQQSGPDFGGKAVKASTEQVNQDGKTPTKANNEYNKGQTINPLAKQNVNTVPGKAGKAPVTTGHEYTKDAKGAEGQTTDGSVPVAKKSVQVQNTGKK